jgi:hypothetical protein
MATMTQWQEFKLRRLIALYKSTAWTDRDIVAAAYDLARHPSFPNPPLIPPDEIDAVLTGAGVKLA